MGYLLFPRYQPSGVIVPGLHVMPVSDEEGAIQILNEAQANRAVAEHQLNMKSSRSHVIYTYYIERTKLTEESSTDAEGDFQFYSIDCIALVSIDMISAAT